MFGMVLVGGIRTLRKVQFDGNKNCVIVAVSVGLAMIPLGNPGFYHNFPSWVETIFDSGITTGSLSAARLTLFFNCVGSKEPMPETLEADIEEIEEEVDKEKLAIQGNK